MAAKQKEFVIDNEISSQIAVYNPFSVKLYFRSLSIIGKKLFNFLYWPKLLAGTVGRR
jgi:hypothetical protein